MPVRNLAKRKAKVSAGAQEAAMPKPVEIVPMDNKLKQPKVLIGLIVCYPDCRSFSIQRVIYRGLWLTDNRFPDLPLLVNWKNKAGNRLLHR